VKSPGAPDTVRWHTGQSGAPDQGTLRLSLALFVEPNTWSFYWLSVNLWHLYNLCTRAKLVSPIICVGQFNHQNQLRTRCKPNSLSPLVQAHPPWTQDNTSRGSPLFSPCVPSRADPSGLEHAATIYSSVQGPPGVETPKVGAPGRGLLRVDEQLPVKLQMGSLQQPLQPRTLLRFGSLEFMSLDDSYDMVLLPPPRDNDNGGRQPARRRRNRRRLPPWRKSSIWAYPITFSAAGGGGGATMAKQEAAPRWLSSESTTPAPQRETRRALTSRLRRRRASFPCNTPTPSGRMTPARS
jgi:hypothetical protein